MGVVEFLSNHVPELIVGAASIILLIVGYEFFKKQPKPKGNIASRVWEAREYLRETDKLLGELQDYFQKVEKKLKNTLGA